MNIIDEEAPQGVNFIACRGGETSNRTGLKILRAKALEGANPSLGTDMNIVLKKNINQDFFNRWTSEMSYVLGFVVADGCIVVSKERPNRPFTFNITSVDKAHLYKIRKALNSEHKISKKNNGEGGVAFQIQIRNQIIARDLMKLGIFPRKTSCLNPIEVPSKYFSDFTRGFFDGDGTVYIYKVNGVPQIKAGFLSTSRSFFIEFNKRLCDDLKISLKSLHQTIDKRCVERITQFNTHFYIDDCERLAGFMYKNSPSLYLPRKRRIFERWKSIKRRHYLKKNYPSKIGWYLNKNLLMS